jgi:hypothetical protein
MNIRAIKRVEAFSLSLLLGGGIAYTRFFEGIEIRGTVTMWPRAIAA